MMIQGAAAVHLLALSLAIMLVQDGFVSFVRVRAYSLSVRHLSLTRRLHILRLAAAFDGNDSSNYYDDFSEDLWNVQSSSPLSSDTSNSPDEETTDSLWRELRARQSQIQWDRRKQQKQQWMSASCTTKIALVAPDWVRRLACATYPWVVIGTASDTIFLANLATGQLWGTPRKTNAKMSRISSARLDHVLHQLYGSYDGGGTIAVALHDNIVFEAPRTGGVHLYRWNPKSIASATAMSDGGDGIVLQALGFIASLQDSLVTSLYCKDVFLWVGTDQGLVHAFVLSEDESIEEIGSLPVRPLVSWKVGGASSIVLSIHVNPNIACAVVAMDTGSVDLLYYGDVVDVVDEEGGDAVQLPTRRPIGSFTPPFDSTDRRSSNVYPTCASLVELSNETTSTSHVIVCGANDGSLYLQNIRTKDGTGGMMDGACVDLERPLLEGTVRSLLPNHLAAVRCMAHPENGSGLLVTGGLDGTLRIWDLSTEKFVYQFVGYKVWLGSVWTDGDRIVSDGADNTLIVHDFSLPKVDDESSKRDASSKDGPPPPPYDPMI